MPQTISKRCMLTIQPDTYKILERWARAQGRPLATCITGFLDENRPLFQTMTLAFEAAQAGKTTEALRAMQELTGKALGQLGRAMEGKKHK